MLWVWDFRDAGGFPELSVTGYSEKGTRRLQIMNDGQGQVEMSFINRPWDFASFFPESTQLLGSGSRVQTGEKA